MATPRLYAADAERKLSDYLRARFQIQEASFADKNDPRGPVVLRASFSPALVEALDSAIGEFRETWDLMPDPEWRNRLSTRKAEVQEELSRLRSEQPTEPCDEWMLSARIEGGEAELALIEETQAEWGWAE